MSVLEIPVWRQAPFIRLLLPFSAGIIIGFYLNVPLILCWGMLCLSALCSLVFLFLRTALQHKYYPLNGLFIHLLLASSGLVFVFYHDITNHPAWIGKWLEAGQRIIVTLKEPLAEKPKSYKTTASIEYISYGKTMRKVEGTIIIYFVRDSSSASLQPGFHLVFRKGLQAIRSSGNPGAFNYADYNALQGIYHQVYLSAGEYKIIDKGKPAIIKQFIFSTREQVLAVIRKYIPGKLESGLAEALLIGYKGDLDKTLLQSYAKTGVVHVIAISGLHLGLIYWLLASLFKIIDKGKKLSILKPVIIIGGLWIFSLLAGASPSVLRSALMFTFIVAGETAGKKSSIYNSLAASAFLLLCYNPFWLWDAGFQLSYIAVLSLVVYMQSVYNCVYVKNLILDSIWKLTAVTVAAQILTFPICIYLFHQFPSYFILTNLLAIPLSGVILLAEIFLCSISSLPELAVVCGNLIQWMIVLMNSFIQHVESLPFSTIEDLQFSLLELLLIYLIIISLSLWVLQRSKTLLILILAFIAGLCAVRSFNLNVAQRQQKIIVYNIRGKAVEIINGRTSVFLTSREVLTDPSSEEYLLKPSRISHRIVHRAYLTREKGIFVFTSAGKKITILEKIPISGKPFITDLLIISGNPFLNLEELFSRISTGMVVFDGSNAGSKMTVWKEFCEKEKVRYWNVAEKGAFIINLNSLSFATP